MNGERQRIEAEIRRAARRLFDEKRIDLLIGYERGSLPLRSRPLVITAEQADTAAAAVAGTAEAAGGTEATGAAATAGAADADPVERLVWDSFCANNLAAYLPELYRRDPRARAGQAPPRPRVGLVAKGCDFRSALSLIREHQAFRDSLVLIGVPCRGMIDRARAEALLAGRPLAGWRETADGELELSAREGETLRVPREELLQEACRECRHPVPEGADILIEGPARAPAAAGAAVEDGLAGLPAAERWARFRAEVARCIRCNACRQACPNCWCRECFAEQTDLRWIGATTELSDTMIFHLIRIFHQAGRCVGCDACLRACPVGVDLRPYTRRIARDVEELFGYVPGFSLEEIPPLSTFRENDSQDFITEP